ncbi:High mobility group HMG-I/HMG-Y [Penicillium alfredii]|uniref:Thymocyte nuclear protein 1 n=1 Tax=Penicillium alfredii TaxID=1506179 RepID=A0A9W9K7S2_9EURO|nr:High mobility group HMG-I/HMG-Y [Penicillium alfredii]KAJ5096000.1 High mobility group HMG-I/HMG-Y [Penicillium alfredii]
MPPKRKSEDAAVVNPSDLTPAKQPHNISSSSPGSGEGASQVAATPQTGEKRKRGRPRKYPDGSTPKPASDGPKRGRGRPRKVVSETQTGTTPSPGPKKGRGRPRKEPGSATPAAPIPKPKKKDGRGRPRKNPPPNGTAQYTESPFAEPESRLEKGVDVKFSIDDLAAAKTPEPWDDAHVNIQWFQYDSAHNLPARNLMRDMKKGDHAFFYHSNCKVPGVVGIMEIVQEHSVDESAFDPAHPYYDSKADRDDPKWVVVHVEHRRKLKNQVTLNDLKSHAHPGQPLENLQTLKQTRLSVSSVTPAQWRFILGLAGEDPQEVSQSLAGQATKADSTSPSIESEEE